MKTTELISILNSIITRYGDIGCNARIHMDAIESQDAEYVICEVWGDAIDVYVTDDDKKFIDTHCFDDEGGCFTGLKSITIWHVIGGLVHDSQVF